MKRPIVFRIVSGVIVLSIMLTGCSSTTTIHSRPTGAKVYIDNISRGTTPCRYSDSGIVGTSKSLKLVKEGYQPLITEIRHDEFKIGPCIGGIFFLFPFLWVEGYPASYEFELEPIAPTN